MGGDCLNMGCVPSKAFLKCASVVHNAKHGENYGLKIKGEVEVDFPAIMTRMKKIRADIAENDSAQRFGKNMGIDLFFGHAKFTG
jgi:pyruvate/2-oxoglutarate dehydrogenase complex dihydrolipoamide dehydrogenase (E3) component